MPEGWQTVPIGEVLVSAQYGLNLPVTPDGTVPIIGMKDMIDGRVENNGWGHVDLAVSDRARYLLNYGDILLNRTNSPHLVGKVALWTRREGAVFPSYIVRFRANEERADAAFLSCVLNSDDGQTRLKALATRGVSQANINPTIFRKAFTLALPPMAEQRRLATVLGTWDNAIAAAQRLVALATARRTWLVDQLVFATANEVSIGDIASPSSGKAGADFAKYPVLSCTKHDGLVLSDTYFDRTVYGADRTAYKLVAPLTFAYATNHIEEGSIGLNLTGSTGVVSPMYTTFSSDGVDANYLYSVLKTERMRREFERWTPASVNRRGGLRWDEFSMISVPLPSEETQARVVAAIENARLNVNEHKSQAALLRRQKRGLMQKLLTGEWRVAVAGDALTPGGPAADQLEAAE